MLHLSVKFYKIAIISETFSIDNEGGDYSPFDIEKHKKRIQMLKKSPGELIMESRPMYSADKVVS